MNYKSHTRLPVVRLSTSCIVLEWCYFEDFVLDKRRYSRYALCSLRVVPRRCQPNLLVVPRRRRTRDA